MIEKLSQDVEKADFRQGQTYLVEDVEGYKVRLALAKAELEALIKDHEIKIAHYQQGKANPGYSPERKQFNGCMAEMHEWQAGKLRDIIKRAWGDSEKRLESEESK